MKRFALIGAAGYVAPKHMQAIRDVGGELVAALDPHDSVGILDQYFPDCMFFTEFERFDRFCSQTRIDYVSICSPNYLHDAHCRFALRLGADAICEKPVVLMERNLDQLLQVERDSGNWSRLGHDAQVRCILQCRLHPALANLVRSTGGDKKATVKVVYHTPRGNWYKYAWKSDISKSGGLETNIGIHLFDLCSYLYGKLVSIESLEKTEDESMGVLHLERATVNWDLSIRKDRTPKRIFDVDGAQLDLTNGFNDLHTVSYQKILSGDGFGLEDAREAVLICERIRSL